MHMPDCWTKRKGENPHGHDDWPIPVIFFPFFITGTCTSLFLSNASSRSLSSSSEGKETGECPSQGSPSSSLFLCAYVPRQGYILIFFFFGHSHLFVCLDNTPFNPCAKTRCDRQLNSSLRRFPPPSLSFFSLSIP